MVPNPSSSARSARENFFLHRFPGQTADSAGRIRYLDIDAPELPQPWRGRPDAEYLGPESAARMKELIRDGQYVRVVQDSHARAAGTDKYDRQLGYVETLPRPLDNLLRIPYLGKAIPARDTGRTLLQEGLADIGYRHLSGRTDRAVSYDRAREAAQQAELGLWSDEGRLHHPDAGKEKTVAERSDDWYRRMTGEDRPAETFWDKALTPAAIGLMTTGNAPMYAYQPSVRNFRQDERDRLLREANDRAREQAQYPRLTESESWAARRI